MKSNRLHIQKCYKERILSGISIHQIDAALEFDSSRLPNGNNSTCCTKVQREVNMKDQVSFILQVLGSANIA